MLTGSWKRSSKNGDGRWWWCLGAGNDWLWWWSRPSCWYHLSKTRQIWMEREKCWWRANMAKKVLVCECDIATKLSPRSPGWPLKTSTNHWRMISTIIGNGNSGKVWRGGKLLWWQPTAFCRGSCELPRCQEEPARILLPTWLTISRRRKLCTGVVQMYTQVSHI